MRNLDKAIEFAVKAHAGQVDKGNKPYILHPLQVMLWTMKNPDPDPLTAEAEAIAAVMHDMVEDCGSSVSAIRAWFGDKAADAVDALSRRVDESGKKEPYSDFIQRTKANPIAAKVKIYDILHNLSRLHNLPKEERGVETRYVKALQELGVTADWRIMLQII